MEFFIWALIGQDQKVGQIITSQMSFNRVCDLLSSLFRYRVQDSDMITELDNIIKKAAKVEGERDTIIHSCWLGDLESSIIRHKITSRRKTGIRYQYEHMNADNLREVARSISDVEGELRAFMMKADDMGIIDLPK